MLTLAGVVSMRISQTASWKPTEKSGELSAVPKPSVKSSLSAVNFGPLGIESSYVYAGDGLKPNVCVNSKQKNTIGLPSSVPANAPADTGLNGVGR